MHQPDDPVRLQDPPGFEHGASRDLAGVKNFPSYGRPRVRLSVVIPPSSSRTVSVTTKGPGFA